MIITFFRQIGMFALLLLAQGLVLNQVNVLGYATPMLYIYFILSFRRGTSRVVLLLWGFLMGLCADMFTNSPGVAAGATTMLAFCQPLLLNVFVPRDSADDLAPNYKTMGVAGMLRYLFTGTLLFQTLYYLLDAFSLAHAEDILINIGGGTLTSLLLLTAATALSHRS